jgi:hypothetical protein
MSPTTQKIRIIFKRSAIPRTNDAAPCWPQNTDAVPGHLCGCCNSFSVSVSVLVSRLAIPLFQTILSARHEK